MQIKLHIVACEDETHLIWGTCEQHTILPNAYTYLNINILIA